MAINAGPVRNHASAILACDFCVVVTATFRLLYVLVVIEHQTQRIVHCNVTTHPTAAWTLQQLRKAIPSDHVYRFLIHDGDGIFSTQLDRSITHMSLRVLRTPPRSPKANSLCGRVIGTLRRECLDFLIPLNENHLRIVTKNWVTHYNRGRPHASLGPGIPDPPVDLPVTPHKHQHRIPSHCKVELTQSWVDYTMNIAWYRRLHEFLRITGLMSQATWYVENKFDHLTVSIRALR